MKGKILILLLVLLLLAVGCTGRNGTSNLTPGIWRETPVPVTTTPDEGEISRLGVTQGETPAGCPEGLTDCQGYCTDPASDPGNCGGCGNACPPDQYCMSGTCTAQGTVVQTTRGRSCPGHLTPCGGFCVDVTKDRWNCGSCGNDCGEGSSCVGGACGEKLCENGRTRCAGTCVDTDLDTRNCGTCGRTCGSNEDCFEGRCITQGDPCRAHGRTSCDGTCVDLYSDPDHCGSCMKVCGSGKSCVEGECLCPTDWSDCAGICVDRSSDPDNCGLCRYQCDDGEICVDGECTEGEAEPCPEWLTDCGGICVELGWDPENCGSCGTVCSEDQFCIEGSCVV